MPATRKSNKEKPTAWATTEAEVRFERVIAPTDFSDESEKGVRYASALANSFGAEVHLVYAWELGVSYALMEGGPVVSPGEVEKSSLARMSELARRFGLADTAKQHVRSGRAYAVICDLAATIKADLICLATHGYGGLKRVFLGSTAERVVRHAPCPVLIVREAEGDCLRRAPRGGGEQLVIKHIVAPSDFSEASLAGVRYALALARKCGARVTLLHTIYAQPFIPTGNLDIAERLPAPGVLERAARLQMRELLRKLDAKDVEVRPTIQFGRPAHEICRFADITGPDLIVTATHGLTGIAHVLIGSTAEHVVRYAQCPVLVVPSQPERDRT